MSGPARVLVAGGGVAGLETVLALQARGEDLAPALLAPGRHFVHRPLAVLEPFADEPQVLRLPLAEFGRERGVPVHRDALARVLADERAVLTADGERLAYDALVVALGARPVEAVRGRADLPRAPGRRPRARARAARGRAAGARAGLRRPPGHDVVAAALRAGAPGRRRRARGGADHARHARARAAGRVRGACLGRRRGRPGRAGRGAARGDRGVGGRGRRAAHRRRRAARRRGGRARAAHRPAPARPTLRPARLRAGRRARGRARRWTACSPSATSRPRARSRAGWPRSRRMRRRPRSPRGRPGSRSRRSRRAVLRGALVTGAGTLYLRHERGGPSEASWEPLWWPPAKLAARHLSHHLAARLTAA